MDLSSPLIHVMMASQIYPESTSIRVQKFSFTLNSGIILIFEEFILQFSLIKLLKFKISQPERILK